MIVFGIALLRSTRHRVGRNRPSLRNSGVRPRSLLLVLLLVLLSSCDGESPTSPSATISGVVKDAYGNVWGGVTVGMVTERGVVDSGLTGHDGIYSIARLRPGHYRVWLQLGRTGPGSFVGEVDLVEGHTTFDIVTH